MELASPPQFKRANKILLAILATATAVLVCFAMLIAWLEGEPVRGWFATPYICAAIIALVTAIAGIPVSLAGLVYSRGELRALLIAGTSCLASIAVLGLFVSAYFALDNGLRNIYGSASAAPLVIEHMRTHDGRWPRNWDELHQTYLVMERKPWSPWEDLHDRTEIDFEVDPAKLAKMKSDGQGAPFCVIWARRKKVDHYPGTIDPNQQVFEYLRSEYSVRHTDTKGPAQSKAPLGK